jgi:hypothetical protein
LGGGAEEEGGTVAGLEVLRPKKTVEFYILFYLFRLKAKEREWLEPVVVVVAGAAVAVELMRLYTIASNTRAVTAKARRIPQINQTTFFENIDSLAPRAGERLELSSLQVSCCSLIFLQANNRIHSLTVKMTMERLVQQI